MINQVFARRIFRLSSQNLNALNTKRPLSSQILKSKVDIYNGVSITEDLLSISTAVFDEKLAVSLNNWSSDNLKGVWLRLPIEISHLVPVAVRHGFWFHHCSSDYILMCNWLQGGKETSLLPAAPSHYIGVAGFVLNSQRELLVIQEKHGPAAGQNLWKLPGGLLDLHEDISKGVVREVREETGIECNFSRLVAIVEGHHGSGPARESASDLYCVSVLNCTDETQPIVPQVHEIEKCQWVPVKEVLTHPLYGPGTAFGACFRSALAVCNGNTVSSTNVDSTKQTGAFSFLNTQGLVNSVLPVVGKRTASVYHVDHESN